MWSFPRFGSDTCLTFHPPYLPVNLNTSTPLAVVILNSFPLRFFFSVLFAVPAGEPYTPGRVEPEGSDNSSAAIVYPPLFLHACRLDQAGEFSGEIQLTGARR